MTPATSRAKGGRYGPYGGRYVPETLISALDELARAYDTAVADPAFREELDGLLTTYVGRPTPLSDAPRLSEAAGARVLLKREDLCHTGAHKINNTMGQVLLAQRIGKRRIIAETGAGQHGVATATACARFGLECVVYMGEEDMRRQRLNVYRMEVMGAKVVPVSSGTKTLKDATNEALRDWGHEHWHHALHHRLGGGAGSVPAHRRGLSVRDRARGAGPGDATDRVFAAHRGRVRGRRIQCHGHLRRVPGRQECEARRRRGRGRGHRDRPPFRVAQRGQARRVCTAA